jgi:hypothetical protein
MTGTWQAGSKTYRLGALVGQRRAGRVAGFRTIMV